MRPGNGWTALDALRTGTIPLLAWSLDNLSARFSELGHPAEALTIAQEAVTVRRELAAIKPDQYRPLLADSLTNLGDVLLALKRTAAATPLAWRPQRFATDLKKFTARSNRARDDLGQVLGTATRIRPPPALQSHTAAQNETTPDRISAGQRLYCEPGPEPVPVTRAGPVSGTGRPTEPPSATTTASSASRRPAQVDVSPPLPLPLSRLRTRQRPERDTITTAAQRMRGGCCASRQMHSRPATIGLRAVTESGSLSASTARIAAVLDGRRSMSPGTRRRPDQGVLGRRLRCVLVTVVLPPEACSRPAGQRVPRQGGAPSPPAGWCRGT